MKIEKSVFIHTYKKDNFYFCLIKISIVMNKFLILLICTVLFLGCHESLEEKAAREAKEFTRRNCPMPVSEYIVNDSMTYDKGTRTIHYYYTIKGAADTTAINNAQAKAELIKGVKGATSIRTYKENGFNFAYTYYSQKHKGKILLDIRITPADYK